MASRHNPQGAFVYQREINLHAIVEPVWREKPILDFIFRYLDDIPMPAKGIGSSFVSRKNRCVIHYQVGTQDLLYSIHNDRKVERMVYRFRPFLSEEMEVILPRLFPKIGQVISQVLE